MDLSDTRVNEDVEGCSVRFDSVEHFGDEHDGVISCAGVVEGGVIETSYFYGDLKPKNIVVISTQVGCAMRCNFCELGPERFVRSLIPHEMYNQVALMLMEAQAHGIDVDSKAHKVTLANSGEPLLNKNLVQGLEMIAELPVSFKVSTVFPHGVAKQFIDLAMFTSWYRYPVQPQVSLISTSETYRQEAIGIRVAPFKEIREASDFWRLLNPKGRKVNLSLILSENVPCDVNEVIDIFPPELFRFRFRNYVPTENGTSNGVYPISQERFEAITKQFRDRGYEITSWATPTATEQKYGIAPNVIRKRYLKRMNGR